jgi:hypothetical protein
VNERYGPTVRALSVLHADEPTSSAPISASLFDSAGHAHRAYDAKDDMLVLVRPDGYIGLIASSDSLRRLEAYMEKVG